METLLKNMGYSMPLAFDSKFDAMMRSTVFFFLFQAQSNTNPFSLCFIKDAQPFYAGVLYGNLQHMQTKLFKK